MVQATALRMVIERLHVRLGGRKGPCRGEHQSTAVRVAPPERDHAPHLRGGVEEREERRIAVPADEHRARRRANERN